MRVTWLNLHMFTDKSVYQFLQQCTITRCFLPTMHYIGTFVLLVVY